MKIVTPFIAAPVDRHIELLLLPNVSRERKLAQRLVNDLFWSRLSKLITIPDCLMSLAHFWKIVMISSQPSEQYGFTTLFLFLLFLNSDIGIVILYIVKYIRKAFSLPKKINFEVQNLTNIHVFRFAFSDLYCYHTDLQNARNAVSDNLIFKISRGGMPPDPPSKERLRRSLVRIINWSQPPVKNPGYGPGGGGNIVMYWGILTQNVLPASYEW